jgi:hypothetical protein
MLFLIILLQLTAVLQIRAVALGQASWFTTRVVVSLVDVNSKDASIQKRAVMWVDIVEVASGYTTTCLLETTFPVSPDVWSFCAGGQFYVRARNLSNATEIDFDLDVARMTSDR